MSVQTWTSEEVRLGWGKCLDVAFSNTDVLVTRFGRPSVALVNYERWSVLQEAAKELSLMKALQRGRENHQRMLENPETAVDDAQFAQMLADAGVID